VLPKRLGFRGHDQILLKQTDWEENIQIAAASNPIKLWFEIVGVLRIEVDILYPEGS
jgi:hypothetical protein